MTYVCKYVCVFNGASIWVAGCHCDIEERERERERQTERERERGREREGREGGREGETDPKGNVWVCLAALLHSLNPKLPKGLSNSEINSKICIASSWVSTYWGLGFRV